jgi:hypothetical protein
VAENEGEPFIIRRILGTSNREFHAVLTHQGSESEHFNEGSFSVALFEALGLEPPRLLSNSGQAAQPYVSSPFSTLTKAMDTQQPINRTVPLS